MAYGEDIPTPVRKKPIQREEPEEKQQSVDRFDECKFNHLHFIT